MPQNNIENFIQDQQMNNNQEKYNLPAPYTNDASNQPMFYQNYNNIPQNQNQEINQYHNIPTQNNQYNNNLNQNYQNGMKKNTDSKKKKINWCYFACGVLFGISFGIAFLLYILLVVQNK